MDELVVAGILLAVSLVVIVCMVLLYKLLKAWKKTSSFSLFQPDEEKSSLTRTEQRPPSKVQ